MKLNIDEVKIPFRETFRHASAVRSMTEAVVVQAESPTGNYGFGEGCPRKYVTGETVHSALEFFTRNVHELENLNCLAHLKSWLSDHQELVDENPAAFCAIELALLNVYAADTGVSVEDLLSLPALRGKYQYTAVIGSGDPAQISERLRQYIKLGFSDFKIKLCGKSEVDVEIVSIFNSQETELRVRYDANNLWDNADHAIDYLERFAYPLFALEEPLSKQNFAGCRKIHETFGSQIILDESFLRDSDFSAISDDPNRWIINLRISKMGGCLRSLAIAKTAKALGIPLVIGAQVGETSILTRAALTIANASRDNLIAQEGAFGTHLLEFDICEPALMFGNGGVLDARQTETYNPSIRLGLGKSAIGLPERKRF